MKTQIIKYDIDINLVTELLLKLGYISTSYLIIDKETIQSCIFNDVSYLNSVLTILKEKNYHTSKYYYLERDMSYKSLITIIRQILKYKQIDYFTKIKYVNSSYFTQYFIYYPLRYHI